MFARKESAIPSFGIRIQSLLDTSNIPNDNVHATVIPQVLPWTMHHPKVCLDLSVLAKIDTPSHIYIQKLNEIKDQYTYCTPIYTDGSKDNDRVGCGLVINNLSIKQRLPSNASIFTAECTACQEIYSVRHVLIDCSDLGLIRPRFYSVPDMKALFNTVSVDRILSFMKEIKLLQRSKMLNY